MWYTQPSHGPAAGTVMLSEGLVRAERNSCALNTEIQVLEALARFQ